MTVAAHRVAVQLNTERGEVTRQQDRGDQKPRKRSQAKNQAALDAEVAKIRDTLGTIRVGFIALAFPLSILACWPIAEALAGEKTVVDATIAISVSVTLAITTAFTGGLAYQQTRRANKARRRVGELNSQVKIAQLEAQTARTMLEELRGDLEGLRRDRDLAVGKRRP